MSKYLEILLWLSSLEKALLSTSRSEYTAFSQDERAGWPAKHCRMSAIAWLKDGLKKLKIFVTEHQR